MDVEVDFSSPDTPGVATPDSYEDSVAYDTMSLETYLASVPYKCESIPQMHAKLQWIVGRLLVCVKSKDWQNVHNCDSLLHWSVSIFRFWRGGFLPSMAIIQLAYASISTV